MKKHFVMCWPPFFVRGLSLLAATLTSACSDPEESRPREVMVVATTDMAVPNDFNRLWWSVTLAGETEPFDQGTVELESNADFPATLVIGAGPKTTEPVTIRIEGRKRGTQDLVRVRREAILDIPSGGTKKLAMPLSWLCSDANLPEPCANGQTCKGGLCSDAAVPDSLLPVYEQPTPQVCTSVAGCLDGHMVQGLPARDPETGDCIIQGSSRLGDDADVNVVLTIDNERVGNYGFCGPFNECYVLLPREDGPEGWQVLSSPGDTPVIKLPDALCQDHVARNVSKVGLLLGPTASCPIYERDTPLCPPPENTCLDAEVCPSTWPAAWSGYACSGSVVPEKTASDLLYCFHPELGAGQPPTAANGRFCCTSGEAPADDPLLIDDMSGGPQLKLTPPEGQVAGLWWTSLGEGSGSLAPAPHPSLYTYRTFDPPIQAENGTEISAAACMSSSGFLGYVAMQGFYFSEQMAFAPGAEPGGARVPWDLSEFTGISFLGWAAEPFPGASLSIEVEFPNKDTNWGDRTSPCWSPEHGSKRCDNFQADVTLTSKWERHFVTWDGVHQSREEWVPPQYRPPGGFDRTTVDSTIFTVVGAHPDIMSQPFDFCVAHVYFTR